MSPSQTPGYLITSQVADLLHVSPKTVARWSKDGKLPFTKTLGGHRRYPDAEIRELANGLRFTPDPAAPTTAASAES